MTVALSIAGSDPSGGAGLQADIKTFHQHGVYATTVVTLLTVQNTQAVTDVRLLDPDFVLAQLDAVLNDIPPAAAKTGALGDRELIRRLSRSAAQFRFPLIVDPVMISKHGHPLIEERAVEAMIHELLPVTYLVTPNRFEAGRLSGIEVNSRATMLAATDAIRDLGVENVLLKGGEIEGRSLDLLRTADGSLWLESERLVTRSSHGSGCVFSAALTARIALGQDLHTAARGAKAFVTSAMRSAPHLGQGIGPLNLMVPAFPDPDKPS